MFVLLIRQASAKKKRWLVSSLLHIALFLALLHWSRTFRKMSNGSVSVADVCHFPTGCHHLVGGILWFLVEDTQAIACFTSDSGLGEFVVIMTAVCFSSILEATWP
jgi:hypothetical protein